MIRKPVLSPEDAEAQREWARALVATWPPLTEGEKARLRVLMLGSDEGDDVG